MYEPDASNSSFSLYWMLYQSCFVRLWPWQLFDFRFIISNWKFCPSSPLSSSLPAVCLPAGSYPVRSSSQSLPLFHPLYLITPPHRDEGLDSLLYWLLLMPSSRTTQTASQLCAPLRRQESCSLNWGRRLCSIRSIPIFLDALIPRSYTLSGLLYSTHQANHIHKDTKPWC